MCSGCLLDEKVRFSFVVEMAGSLKVQPRRCAVVLTLTEEKAPQKKLCSKKKKKTVLIKTGIAQCTAALSDTKDKKPIKKIKIKS